MRIVYIPTWSSAKLTSNPAYNYLKAFLRNIQDSGMEVFFYVFVPRAIPESQLSSFKQTLDNELFALPNVRVIYTQCFTLQQFDQSIVTKEMYDLLGEAEGGVYYDAVINERVSVTWQLQKMMLMPVNSRSVKPPIFTFPQMVFSRKLRGTQSGAGVEDELVNCVNHALSYSIVHSNAQLNLIMATMREHLTPARIKDFLEAHVKFTFGIDCDDIDRIISGIEKENAVHWSHKLYNMPLKVRAFEMMQYAYELRSWKPYLTSGSVADIKIPDEFKAGHFNIRLGATREEFLQRAAKAKICISNNKYEDFSATVCEQIYAGCLPILHRSEFAEYVTPPDYPLLFDTDEQLKKAVLYAIDNYDALAAEWVPKCKAYVKENFDAKKKHPELIQLIEQKYLDHRKELQMPGSIVDLVRDVLVTMKRTGYETATMDDLFKNMKQLSENRKEFGKFVGQHTVSRLMVYQIAKTLAKDDVTQEVPTFLLSTVNA